MDLSIFRTTVEWISFVILAFEIILTIFNKYGNLKGGFFNSFALSGSFGLLSYAFNFEVSRYLKLPDVPNTNYLSFLYLMTGFTLHGYLISQTLTSLNRFTAIGYPIEFEKIWRPKRVFLMFIAIVIFCIISVCYRIGVTVTAWLNPATGKYIVNGYIYEIQLTSTIVTVAICFLVTAFNLGSNIASLLIWRKSWERLATKQRDVNRNLLIFTVISAVMSSLVCLQQLFTNLFRFMQFFDIVNMMVYWYFPLNTFSIFLESYSIIYFSSAMRNEIYSVLHLRLCFHSRIEPVESRSRTLSDTRTAL